MKGIYNKLIKTDLNSKSKEITDPVTFGLLYRSLPVGILTYHEGIWNFRYTEIFKHQDAINPIVGFADKSKVYNSNELWPFFASRIPGVNQPMVKKLVDKLGEKVLTEVELLKHFGKHTIANPFTLDSDYKLSL